MNAMLFQPRPERRRIPFVAEVSAAEWVRGLIARDEAVCDYEDEEIDGLPIFLDLGGPVRSNEDRTFFAANGVVFASYTRFLPEILGLFEHAESVKIDGRFAQPCVAIRPWLHVYVVTERTRDEIVRILPPIVQAASKTISYEEAMLSDARDAVLQACLRGPSKVDTASRPSWVM
jgi:hypothetical protein